MVSVEPLLHDRGIRLPPLRVKRKVRHQFRFSSPPDKTRPKRAWSCQEPVYTHSLGPEQGTCQANATRIYVLMLDCFVNAKNWDATSVRKGVRSLAHGATLSER